MNTKIKSQVEISHHLKPINKFRAVRDSNIFSTSQFYVQLKGLLNALPKERKNLG